MQTTVKTSHGQFTRTAWTGGSVPPQGFAQTELGQELVEYFYHDQLDDCGGLANVKNWLFGGNTLEDKLAIFRNRALLDAWATYRANQA